MRSPLKLPGDHARKRVSWRAASFSKRSCSCFRSSTSSGSRKSFSIRFITQVRDRRTAKRVPSSRPFDEAIDVAHHACLVPHVEHAAEQPLEVDRFRRVQHRREHGVADTALDAAEQRRPSGGRREDRVQQESGRGLAARSGDADDVELTRRVAERLDRRARHRGANGGDDELRHVRVDAALADESDGAAADRLGCELVPVDICAGNAEEQRSRPNVSRVVGQLLDLEGARRTTSVGPSAAMSRSNRMSHAESSRAVGGRRRRDRAAALTSMYTRAYRHSRVPRVSPRWGRRPTRPSTLMSFRRLGVLRR